VQSCVRLLIWRTGILPPHNMSRFRSNRFSVKNPPFFALRRVLTTLDIMCNTDNAYVYHRTRIVHPAWTTAKQFGQTPKLFEHYFRNTSSVTVYKYIISKILTQNYYVNVLLLLLLLLLYTRNDKTWRIFYCLTFFCCPAKLAECLYILHALLQFLFC